MLDPPVARGLPGGCLPGPMLLFVHGLGDDWRSWSALAQALDVPGARMAVDMPWRAGGAPGWRRSGTSGEWLAAALAGVDDDMVLIGHSFGANAVLEHLAVRRPERVLAAVLLAPTYLPPRISPTWGLFDHVRVALERDLGEGVRARLRAHTSAARRAHIDRLVATVVDRVGPDWVLAAFDQYTASGHLPVERIATPTLVLAGGRDPGVARADLVALAGRLPVGTLHCDPDFDHFAHLHRVEEVAGRVATFLAMVDRAPRHDKEIR